VSETKTINSKFFITRLGRPHVLARWMRKRNTKRDTKRDTKQRVATTSYTSWQHTFW